MADECTIEVYRGSAPTLQISRSSGNSDPSTWTEIVFTVRKRKGDPGPPLIQKTKSAGQITVATPTIFATLTSGDILMPAGTYYYDVWRTDAAPDLKTEGQFIVKDTARVAA